MGFLYGSEFLQHGTHATPLSNPDRPRTSLEETHELAGNRDSRPDSDRRGLPYLGTPQMTDVQFYILLIVACVGFLFALRELGK